MYTLAVFNVFKVFNVVRRYVQEMYRIQYLILKYFLAFLLFEYFYLSHSFFEYLSHSFLIELTVFVYLTIFLYDRTVCVFIV